MNHKISSNIRRIKKKFIPISIFSLIIVSLFALDVLSIMHIFKISNISIQTVRMRTIGDVFGYATFIFLFLTIITRVGIYRLKKFVKAKKLIIFHNVFGTVTIGTAIIHVVLISTSGTWSNVFTFYEIFPWDNLNSVHFIGLLLGRIALLILFACTLTGTFFIVLNKKIGRKKTTIIHRFSYIAMILAIFHFIFIVKIEHAHIVGFLLMCLVLIITILLTVDFKHRILHKRRNRTKNYNLSTIS